MLSSTLLPLVNSNEKDNNLDMAKDESPLRLDSCILALVSEYLTLPNLLSLLKISKKLSKNLTNSAEMLQIYKYRSSSIIFIENCDSKSIDSLSFIATYCAARLCDMNKTMSAFILSLEKVGGCTALKFVQFVGYLRNLTGGFNLLSELAYESNLFDKAMNSPILFLALAHCILTKQCQEEDDSFLYNRFVAYCNQNSEWIDDRCFQAGHSTWGGHNVRGFRTKDIREHENFMLRNIIDELLSDSKGGSQIFEALIVQSKKKQMTCLPDPLLTCRSVQSRLISTDYQYNQSDVNNYN